MFRLKHWQWLLCCTAIFVGGTLSAATAARAGDDGQALLDQATDKKVAAENSGDLNEVIRLCDEAIKAGLDEGNKKFAEQLLSTTLTQRAELVCMELFERPVTPRRGRKLLEMAISDLERTLSIDAEQQQAQYLMGRLYAHLGQPEKAMKALDAAVRLSDDDPPAKAKALIVRANLQTDMDKRQADYDQAAKLTPKDANVLRFRGLFFLGENKIDEALSDLNAAIELDPKDADTHEARGVALALAKRYDDAMDAFNKAIELAPESPSSYVHRARIRAMKSDDQAALADVQEALKLQPNSVSALQLRASLYASLGKFEQSLDDLNLLRQAMPKNPELLLQIGTIYQVSKQPQKAISTYDELLGEDPKNAPALRGRADAYLSLAKQSEAIDDYKRALTIEPKNSGVLNNLAWVLATSPDDHLRDGKRAIELAQQACEVTEYKAAHIISTLAAGYAEVGDFETAVNWSKKAVELGTDQLKGQLSKELESYNAKKPWREATPPGEDIAPQPTDQGNRGSSANLDTAGNKRGN